MQACDTVTERCEEVSEDRIVGIDFIEVATRCSHDDADEAPSQAITVGMTASSAGIGAPTRRASSVAPEAEVSLSTFVIPRETFTTKPPTVVEANQFSFAPPA